MKTIKFIFSIAILSVLFGTTGCIEDFTIRGNGIIDSESRFVKPFTKVKSAGEFNVHITAGEEYNVIVTAETNLLPYIETEVYNNAMNISVRGLRNIINRRPMEVYITMPYLDELKESGSGIITTDYFVCDDFEVSVSGSGMIDTEVECYNLEANMSGSGRIILYGTTENTNFNISGSGEIKAYNLSVTDCFARISGSGNIYANISRFLDATISGSGNVFYLGYPAIQSHISGSGKIIQDN